MRSRVIAALDSGAVDVHWRPLNEKSSVMEAFLHGAACCKAPAEEIRPIYDALKGAGAKDEANSSGRTLWAAYQSISAGWHSYTQDADGGSISDGDADSVSETREQRVIRARG